ncbi:hypothetical protein QUA42_02680 [Microcoleus sp. Pol11C2]|uniref:hypothetical protein n=1 Tax=Microcoleus sp. Pol11C2 TaxID=3055389 RepID=UPI002FD434E3
MATAQAIPKIGMILKDLASRKIRSSSTGGNLIRTWSASAITTQNNGGFLETVINGAVRFGNFLISAITSAISFSFTKLWSWIVSGVQFIYNFNWNISDTAIDKQIQGLWTSFGGILGGAAGRAIGWLGCGVVPAAAVFSFNQSLGTHLLKEVGEQALDEMLDAASEVINAGFRMGTQATFLWLYKDVRRALKDPNSIFGQGLRAVLGSKTVDNWGTGESWTIAKAVEETVEKIPDVFWRNFTEEMIEEGSEACIEAGFAVAGGIDAFLAQQAMQNNSVLGADRTVEITPDRSAPDERIVLSGSEAVLRPTIVSVLATHQMLGNRDVGILINGMPTDNYITPGVQERRLLIEFREKPAPPWKMPSGKRARCREITVFDVKRGLTWEEIKFAAKQYTSGQRLVTARLNSGHQMQCNASTENEGLQKIKELLKLSTAEILPNGVRDSGYTDPTPRRRALPYLVYPCKAVLTWKKRASDLEGREDIAGNIWEEQRIEIDLWPEREPSNLKPLG